jgi:hypothetical protein
MDDCKYNTNDSFLDKKYYERTKAVKYNEEDINKYKI